MRNEPMRRNELPETCFSILPSSGQLIIIRCGERGYYAELKELLTDAEYAAARESTLTAFYTPPVVIRGIYAALGQMGFTQGNILEIILPSLIQSRGIIKKCAFAV